MGDFNMVEMKADKSTQCDQIICRRECSLFNPLKKAIGVAEPIRDDNGLRYIWYNMRFNGIRVMACLDRCYMFGTQAGQAVLHYQILGDGTIFHHNPISMLL